MRASGASFPAKRPQEGCPYSYDELDLDPLSPSGPWSDGVGSARLTLDLSTGKITGDATGKVGDTLTFTGNESPRAKLKVVITVAD